MAGFASRKAERPDSAVSGQNRTFHLFEETDGASDPVAGMRGSGQGFAYNFGRGIAAMNPFFVGLLSAKLSLGQSIGVFALIAYGLLIIAALLLPETKGRVLTAEA